MKTEIKKLSHKLLHTFLTVLIVFVPFFSLFSPASVYAANEQYNFSDPNTIRVTGGIIDGTATLVWDGRDGDFRLYNGTFQTTSDCSLRLSISHYTNNPGVATARFVGTDGPVIGTPDDAPPCDTSFNRTVNVAIGSLNNGPGQGTVTETGPQRRIRVFYNPNASTDIPSGDDEFVLTGNGVTKQITGVRNNANGLGFQGTFADMDAGSYRICSVRVNPNTCINVTKVRGIFLQVTMRDANSDQYVNIVVRANVGVAPPINNNSGGGAVDSQSAFVNPDTVFIKQNGVVLGRVETENGEWNGEVVEFRGEISGIPPGRYKACSVLLDKCKSFTKRSNVTPTVIIQGDADVNDLDPLDDGLLGRLGDGDETEDPNKCEGGSGVIDAFLGFIVCPLVEGILGVIQWAETNIIIPYLIIDPLDSDDDNNAVYLMWQALRNIAFVLLVVAFMYLVFAETTALGGEAYQLKRLAPRLVMVTVAISLSYLAIGLVIDFFNVLGLGIAQITAWAMKETGQQALVTIDGDLASAGLMAFIAGTGAVALVSALMSGSLAAPLIGIAAVTGIFIVLAVVITLVLRQVVVMGMIILSPLAFVALLLPNTEKLFKTWWSVITKALVMYPLIMLLFAAGKIFGALITTDAFAGSGTMDVAVKSLLGFVANIAPMALIPFTFKLAGGVIGGAWGAMRGGISKGRKGVLGSEHNQRSLLNKSREKSYKNMSERMAGQRSWLPRVPGMRRIRGTTLNQRATRALAGAPLIGGWMAGNERLAGARADAQKRIDEIGATEIGEKRLEEEHVGSKKRNPVDPNATDRRHKGIKGYAREAARKRKDHQRQLMVANHFGHKASYVGSDERNRFFAQDLKERADGGEITHEQADELWEEYGRAGEHINPLIHASILGTSARESREAFATDQSLDGATRTGVAATTVGGVTTHAKTNITGTPQAAIAENLLSNDHVVQEMVTGLTARVGNADQVSPHTLTAMQTVFSDPDSSVVKHIMESQTNRDNIKQVVADLRGRTQAAGYNVSAEQQIINQQTADTLERAHDRYTGMSPPGGTGPIATTPIIPATKI